MSGVELTQDKPRRPLQGIAAQMRPGHRPHGRQKGSSNRYNGDIKRMVVAALEGAGGVDYLIGQAKKNPVAFMGLVGRVLPLQVTGTGTGGAVIYEVRLGELPPPPAQLTEAVVIEAQAEADDGALTITIDAGEE